MKEPDPTDDLDRTILETFDEMHAEAQVTPIFLTFPPRVIESVRSYAKEHSLEPGTLIPFAIKALENRLYEFSEAGEHLLEPVLRSLWSPLVVATTPAFTKSSYLPVATLNPSLPCDSDSERSKCLPAQRWASWRVGNSSARRTFSHQQPHHLPASIGVMKSNHHRQPIKGGKGYQIDFAKKLTEHTRVNQGWAAYAIVESRELRERHRLQSRRM